MSSIADKVESIYETKEYIREAIINKGVEVPDSIPFRQYADKIDLIDISGEGDVSTTVCSSWGRPSERPALPFDEDVGPDEGNIWMLFGAQANAMNDMAIRFSGGIGSIYWGDGSFTGFSSTMREHVYDYATIDVIPDSNGVKWVWIQITFNAGGPPNAIYHNEKPSARPTSTSIYYNPQVYEMYMNTPSITIWVWASTNATRYGLLEYFRWYGKCNLTTLANFLPYSLRLCDCIFDDSSSVTTFTSFLYYSGINGKLELNTSSATTMSSFMRATSNFNSNYNPDTSKCTNLTTSMQNNNSWTFPLVLDIGSLTVDIGITAFINMYSLPSLRLLNMNSIVTSLAVSYSAMSASALADLFEDLYDRTSLTAGSITITGAAGADLLTVEQRAIAHNKNWTIVG